MVPLVPVGTVAKKHPTPEVVALDWFVLVAEIPPMVAEDKVLVLEDDQLSTTNICLVESAVPKSIPVNVYIVKFARSDPLVKYVTDRGSLLTVAALNA
jgi:hypothetical protein